MKLPSVLPALAVRKPRSYGIGPLDQERPDENDWKEAGNEAEAECQNQQIWPSSENKRKADYESQPLRAQRVDWVHRDRTARN
eukprot:1981401-Rhodomonas_salina.1